MSPLLGSRAWKPTARTTELLVEELGDELMVYDQRDDQVHCLGSAAQSVWRACDGKATVEQLGRALTLESGVVDRALGELEACGLLDGEAAGGLTRREAGVRLAKVGAAAAGAPLIYSIAAPTPALAASQAFCQALGTDGCAGAIVNGAKGCASNGNSGCGVCGSAGCACCYTSPMMCGGNITYYRCSAVLCNTMGGNICNTQYIANAGGACVNAGPVNSASGCNNFIGCNNATGSGCNVLPPLS